MGPMDNCMNYFLEQDLKSWGINCVEKPRVLPGGQYCFKARTEYGDYLALGNIGDYDNPLIEKQYYPDGRVTTTYSREYSDSGRWWGIVRKKTPECGRYILEGSELGGGGTGRAVPLHYDFKNRREWLKQRESLQNTLEWYKDINAPKKLIKYIETVLDNLKKFKK